MLYQHQRQSSILQKTSGRLFLEVANEDILKNRPSEANLSREVEHDVSHALSSRVMYLE